MMNKAASHTSSAFRRYGNGLVIAGLLLTVVPFVALAYYNHPTLDDILDAGTVRELGFWQSQQFFYFSHTGRYATTVLLALANPLRYGHWAATWWWVTSVFIFGTFAVLRYAIGAIFSPPTKAAWLMAGTMLSLWLAYAPGLAEGLYWFTGAYTYIASVWLLVAWLAVFVRYAEARRATCRNMHPRILPVVALTVAVVGTPEPLALPFVLLLLLGAGLSAWLKRGRVVVLLAILAVVGSAVSFLAPGNFVRMSGMGASYGVIKTIAYATASTAYLVFTWITNPVLLAVSALLLPALYRMGQQRHQLVVRTLAKVPAGLLAVLLSVVLVSASCPAYYASGTGLPLRARTMLYLLFVIAWFGILLTWCCRQAARKQASAVLRIGASSPMAPLWLAVLGLFFFADYNVQTRAAMLGQGSNNVLRAYRQWLSGDAAAYDAEQRARYRQLTTNSLPRHIAPLQHRPELLVSFDIADVNSPAILQKYRRYLAEQL